MTGTSSGTSSGTSFGARYVAALDDRGPLCAGIDPHAALLARWGLSDDVAGLERFALTAVDALGPVCAVLKPQSAFFERFGSRGVAVLETVLVRAREAGALTVLDVKRGDIGSTSQAYADAYLDPASPLAADAVTVSPFLGFGSLAPFVETARRHDAGLFVLALTSNPEGPEVQRAVTASGASVAATVLAHLREENAGASPLGSFGAVVGATLADLPPDVDAAALDFGGPVLAPGLGAQGGTPADLARLFGPALAHVVGSTSREVLGAGPDPRALADAAHRVVEGLRAVRDAAPRSGG